MWPHQASDVVNIFEVCALFTMEIKSLMLTRLVTKVDEANVDTSSFMELSSRWI